MVDITGFLREVQVWLEETSPDRVSLYGGVQIGDVFVEGTSLVYDNEFREVLSHEMQNCGEAVKDLKAEDVLHTVCTFLDAVFKVSHPESQE